MLLRSVITIVAAIFISQLAVASAFAERKIAFVVGIDKYDNLGQQQQLQRAVNDARSVGGALASLGFEVVRAENVGRGAFNAEWQKFLDKIKPGDTAAIYYSGHGVEIEGLNFLLPRDLPNISYGRQEQLKRESLSVSELLLDLRRRKPQVTLVILDACRDHPLMPPENKSLAWGGGLARMDAPTGTFIMYSAGVGETALDRLPGDDPDKVNSVYTRKLLPLVKTPGVPLHELARQLRLEVHDLAAAVPHLQQPAYYDGLIGKFCLAGCDAVASAPAPIVVPPAPAIKATPTVVQTPMRCNGVEAMVGNERRCLKPGSGKRDWFKDCQDCPQMVVAPAGRFIMGSPVDEPGRSDYEEQVEVTISNPFAVGRFAVKRGEFAAFVAGTGHKTDSNHICVVWTGAAPAPGVPARVWMARTEGDWRSPGYQQDDRHPVVCLKWNDAKAYAAWLSAKTGKVYRLLSEAEREYVTRAGSTTAYWWGPIISMEQANFANSGFGEGRKATVPVESFAANPWGLYSVHGNVWEWTEDCWNSVNIDSPGSRNTDNPGDGSARAAANCFSRVVRGGSFSYEGKSLRSAHRFANGAELRSSEIGFRIARTLELVTPLPGPEPVPQAKPDQQQGLLAINKTLVENIQKQHANCEKTTKDVCVWTRVDVLEEVLEKWENTPAYGRYAVDVLEWQNNLSTAIGNMADDYVLHHGHLDAGFTKEIRHRMVSDPVFQPPKEYVYRHLGLAK